MGDKLSYINEQIFTDTIYLNPKDINTPNIRMKHSITPPISAIKSAELKTTLLWTRASYDKKTVSLRSSRGNLFL